MCRHINVFTVRQILLLIAICGLGFSSGVHLAFPSVLNPAILAKDADVKATSDQASWIAACLGIGGLLGFMFIPVIFQIFGRKAANITSNLVMCVGNLIFYVANDVYILIIARLVQGLSYGGSFSCVITLCECVPPKRRGYFMMINKVCVGLGSFSCHALGFNFNWRQIAVFGTLPNLLSLILLMYTAESPSFFANHLKFDKCEEVFKWYRGDSLEGNKELKELIVAQKENYRLKQTDKNLSLFKKTKKTLLTKEFQKSFYIVTLATLCIDSSGRYILFAYITQIVSEITENKLQATYISIAIDCILIFAVCVSSIAVKYYERRTLLFKLGFSSAFLMFMVSLSIILQNSLGLLHNMKWLTPAVLLLHTFVTNVGLIPIAFALPGEVFSLDQRALGTFMSGIIFLLFFNVILKVTPAMIENTGVEGTYAIYGLCLFVFLLLLRILLPETKDKTLQTIEDEIKGTVRNKAEIELMDINLK